MYYDSTFTTILVQKGKRDRKKKDRLMLEESPQRTSMAAGAGKPRPFSGNLILVGVLEHLQHALYIVPALKKLPV
jgi:hypothetical protein